MAKSKDKSSKSKLPKFGGKDKVEIRMQTLEERVYTLEARVTMLGATVAAHDELLRPEHQPTGNLELGDVEPQEELAGES